jgi:hypothetical protein
VLLVLNDRIERHMDMCNINGVWLTPEHPVCLKGVWFYPKRVVPAVNICVDRLFHFELVSGHAVFINNTEVICLGEPDMIPANDPAFCANDNAQWGSGWHTNPRRQLHFQPQSAITDA